MRLVLRSHFPAVIRPVQQGLSLDGPARQISFAAMSLKLGDVPLHGLPPLDLASVIL